MKLSDLIERLQKLQRQQGDTDVMVLDGHNGGGSLRDINLGPVFKNIRPKDAEATGDCEDRVGERVVALGFGCY